MNKRFIRVAVFCALTATAAPVFVGCSDDYDADIANLQSQIDKINSVIGVSGDDMANAINQVVEQLETRINELSTAVEGKVSTADLTAKVTELNTLIDAKADPSQIQAVAEELQSKIDEVNEAASNANEAAKAELEQKISDLEAAHNEAEEALNAALNGKVDQDALDSEAGRLEALIADAKEIAEGAVTSEQLDGKIVEVQSQIDALNTKLESAATSEDINEIINQLSAAKGELQLLIDAKATPELIDEKIAAYDAELQEVLDGKASATIVAGLRGEVSALTTRLKQYENNMQQLETLSDQLGTATAEITKLQGDLTDFGNRISALENADIKLSDYAEFTALASSVEELNTKYGVLGSSLDSTGNANKLAIQEINDKINGYINEETGEEVKGIFDRLVTLENWKSQMESSLDLTGLTEGQVVNMAQILKDIEELQLIVKGQSEEGEEGEDATLNFYNKTEIDQKFAEVEKKMESMIISSINDMLQSIVYVPFANGEGNGNYTTDGGLDFKALVINPVSKTTPVAQSGSNKISFRVSPAAAAAKVAKYYNLVLDGKRVKSGATLPVSFSVGADNKVKEPTVDTSTGIITYDVDFNALPNSGNNEQTWIICAALQYKDKAEFAAAYKADHPEVSEEELNKLTAQFVNERGDSLTNITSDYFKVSVYDLAIDEVKLKYYKEDGKTTKDMSQICYADFEGSTIPSSLDFNDCVYEGYKKNQDNSLTLLSSDLIKEFGDGSDATENEFEENLYATFSMTSKSSAFSMSEGVLTPSSSAGSSNVGSTADVKGKIYYGNTEIGKYPGPNANNVQTVTMVKAMYALDLNLTSDFKAADTNEAPATAWLGSSSRTYTLNDAVVNQIQNALRLTGSDFSALSQSDNSDVTGVTFAVNGGKITVTYAAGTYIPKATTIDLEFETKTAITANLTVNLPATTAMPVSETSLSKAAGFWTAAGLGNVNLNIGADKDNFINAFDPSQNLGLLFSNYTTIRELVAKNGGKFTWTVKQPSNNLQFTTQNSADEIKGTGTYIQDGILTIGNAYDRNDKDYKTPKIELVADFTGAVNDGKQHKVTLATFEYEVNGFSNELTVTKNRTFTALTEELDLNKGTVWSITPTGAALPGVIWEDGDVKDGGESEVKDSETGEITQTRSAMASGKDAFTMFGLKEPEFTIAGATVDDKAVTASTYVVLKDGKLSIKPEAANYLAPGSTLKVQVTVKATSRFGKSATETITATATVK